jgi:hypothetical protein
LKSSDSEEWLYKKSQVGIEWGHDMKNYPVRVINRVVDACQRACTVCIKNKLIQIWRAMA